MHVTRTHFSNKRSFVSRFIATRHFSQKSARARLGIGAHLPYTIHTHIYVQSRNTKGSGNVSSVENFYFRNGGVFGETVKNKDVQMCFISLSLKFGSNRIDIAGFTSLFRAVNNSK